MREGGRLVESDGDTAMERIVSRSRALLEERGPGSIGFYTSGRLFLSRPTSPPGPATTSSAWPTRAPRTP